MTPADEDYASNEKLCPMCQVCIIVSMTTSFGTVRSPLNYVMMCESGLHLASCGSQQSIRQLLTMRDGRRDAAVSTEVVSGLTETSAYSAIYGTRTVLIIRCVNHCRRLQFVGAHLPLDEPLREHSRRSTP